MNEIISPRVLISAYFFTLDDSGTRSFWKVLILNQANWFYVNQRILGFELREFSLKILGKNMTDNVCVTCFWMKEASWVSWMMKKICRLMWKKTLKKKIFSWWSSFTRKSTLRIVRYRCQQLAEKLSSSCVFIRYGIYN